MTVANGIFFLAGALGGTLLLFGAIALGHRHGKRNHEKDPIYAAARFAAVMHLRRYGHLTHSVLKDALGIHDMTVERYLDMLEREGVIRRHGHGLKAFYTQA